MSVENDNQTDTRPCLRLIIEAAELAPPDESHESMEYGLKMARELGGISFVHGCRLEYDQGFYCEDSDTSDCILRKAFKN